MMTTTRTTVRAAATKGQDHTCASRAPPGESMGFPNDDCRNINQPKLRCLEYAKDGNSPVNNLKSGRNTWYSRGHERLFAEETECKMMNESGSDHFTLMR